MSVDNSLGAQQATLSTPQPGTPAVTTGRLTRYTPGAVSPVLSPTRQEAITTHSPQPSRTYRVHLTIDLETSNPKEV